jgi:Phage Terminase
MNIDRAFRDKRLFATALGDLSTWQLWLTILCAAFGLPLTAEQMQLFAAVSGGRPPPAKQARELWIVAGRRSGKSRIAALVAVFIALFVKHRKAPGERPMVLVIAGSVDQSATVFSYIRGFIEASPVLVREAVAIKRHEIELRNGVVIAVHANSFRTVRGRTLVAAIFDEVSFWKDETSATPDARTRAAGRCSWSARSLPIPIRRSWRPSFIAMGRDIFPALRLARSRPCQQTRRTSRAARNLGTTMSPAAAIGGEGPLGLDSFMRRF